MLMGIISILVRISEPSMPGQIHTRQLVLCGNPQQLHLIQPPKQRPHCGTDPPDNNQNLNHVRRQQLPSAPHKQPVPPPRPIHLLHILLFGKQRREYHPPRAAASVQLRRFQGIVKLNPLRECVARDQNERGEEPTHDRGPGLDHRTTGGYSSEPT
ncbi:hypothetical protein CR513_21731, partial [Mucuna pruriens]